MVANKIILEREIHAIKLLLLEDRRGALVLGDWISHKNLQRFFDYSDSQIKRMVKNENLTFTRICNRKFVSIASVLNLLDRKVQ